VPLEPEFPVQALRVFRHQNLSGPRDGRVSQQALDEGLPQPPAPMTGGDDHVANPREGARVRDRPRAADQLPIGPARDDDDGMAQGLFHLTARSFAGPIGVFQKGLNGVDVRGLQAVRYRVLAVHFSRCGMNAAP
jgi:hypothetical protein